MKITVLPIGLICLSIASISINNAQATLQSKVENVPTTNVVYQLHDSAGHGMTCLKVTPDPTTAGRYLAVYHWDTGGGFYNIGVATSTDLKTWTYKRTLVADSSSQPYLAFSPKNGPVLAVETASGNVHIRVYYWTSVSKMLGTGAPYATHDILRTLSTCAEGTPSIEAVLYDTTNSTITSGSSIIIAHHYYSNCSVDREARGTLRNFSSWSTAADSGADSALTVAGSNSKHGDRDMVLWGGNPQWIYEGATTPFSMATWRPYLLNGSTATRLSVHTKGGSTAFANPSFTRMNISGVDSLFVSFFIPSSGAATGETGELIYWVPVN